MTDEFDEKKLDSPLVVHKITDASYQETANEVDVDFTHNESEAAATLERHRYRKVKKAKKWPYVVVAIVVAVVIVIAALYFSGVIKPANRENSTTDNTTGYVQEEENKYKGIITVKNSYIFFEGEEVDGINGLNKELQYIDDGASFILQNDHANEAFFSEEVIPLLDSLGVKYEAKTVVSSGLTSIYETASAPAQ